MRLTVDLVECAAGFINAINDREIDLRRTTCNQFDTLDLTGNEIRKLENFPHMSRLKNIYISGNRVSKIEERLEASLPNLETIIMHDNLVEDLKDLVPLASVKTLRILSLIGNPVTKKENYRLFVAYHFPGLALLDFQKISPQERQKAKELFGSGSNVFVPGEGLNSKPSEKEIKRIKEAIKNAKTLEEVSHLENQLKSGQFTKTQ